MILSLYDVFFCDGVYADLQLGPHRDEQSEGEKSGHVYQLDHDLDVRVYQLDHGLDVHGSHDDDDGV